MYDGSTRRAALRLLSQGRTLSEVSRELAVSRSALKDWRDNGWEPKFSSSCYRCESLATVPPDPAAYSHRLGLYLGDGCISHMRRGVYSLRVACCDAYPRLIGECEASIKAVRPGAKVFRVQESGCTAVVPLWKHWPCLFPQHGPGRKHERHVVLEPWQEEIVRAHPGPFLRGLFHSDGCRITNWTVKVVNGEPKRYEYPRYFFTNFSEDILGLCTWALDLVGIEHRRPSPRNISVARRASVAILDQHVGPKS